MTYETTPLDVLKAMKKMWDREEEREGRDVFLILTEYEYQEAIDNNWIDSEGYGQWRYPHVKIYKNRKMPSG